MGATGKSVYHQKRFHGSIFFDPLPPSIFHGRSFLPMATSSTVTLRNRRTHRTLHGSFFYFLSFNFNFNFLLFINIKFKQNNLDY